MLGGLLVLLNFSVPPVKRNNPFNVKMRQSGYFGVKGVDENGFVIFKFWVFGLLAGISVIRSYQEKGVTLEEMIRSFSATDQNSYINFVVENTGIDNEKTGWSVPLVAEQMCKFELGFQPFYTALYFFFYYLTYLIY